MILDPLRTHVKGTADAWTETYENSESVSWKLQRGSSVLDLCVCNWRGLPRTVSRRPQMPQLLS